MTSCLVLDELAKHFSGRQIDQMMKVSKELRFFFGRNRLNMTRSYLQEMDILTAETEGDVYLRHYPDNGLFMIKVKMEDVMKYLESVHVGRLFLKNDTCGKFLEERWLKYVGMVEVCLIENEEDYKSLLQKLHSPNLIFSGPSFELDADEILNRMKAVERLEIQNARISPDFVSKLIHKSREGDGIKQLTIGNMKDYPMDPFDLLRLLQNGRFARKPIHTYIHVRHVAGTRQDLWREMKEMVSISRRWRIGKGWIDGTRRIFIKSPFSILIIEIRKYISE